MCNDIHNVYVCVYISIHMHVQVIHIHMYIYICIMHTYVCIYRYISIFVYRYMHTCMHILYVHTHIIDVCHTMKTSHGGSWNLKLRIAGLATLPVLLFRWPYLGNPDYEQEQRS